MEGVASLGSGRGLGPVPWSMDGLPWPWLLRPGKARPGSVWRPGTITGAAGSRSIPGEGPGPLGWWVWGALGVEKQLPMVAASGLGLEDV